MAETTVENQVCNDCGADVRPNALFCYNCGAAVPAESFSHDKADKTLRKTIVKEKKSKSKTEHNLISQPEQFESGSENSSTTGVTEKSKTNGKEDVKLESAAALRNKARKLEPKMVEIIWEEHKNAPNVWFIAAAVLLLIFTIVIYFIAMTLK
jgi:hypothetical protein